MPTILLSLGLALAAARIAARLSERAHLPPLVGEVVAGLGLANLVTLVPGFRIGTMLSTSTFMHSLAELGIVLMLFEVGLESRVSTMLRAGGRAYAVALIGVAAPLLLAVALWKLGPIRDLLPGGDRSQALPIFIGATLVATSAGVTLRLLADAGLLRSETGRLILNAAAIDDVLGLLLLAGVTSLAATSAISVASVGSGLGRVALFAATAIPAGVFLFPRLLHGVRAPSLAFEICVCLFFAWYGSYLGLAPIVGAFLAGLLMDDEDGRIRSQVGPIVDFLSPLFFVLIGAHISLARLSGAGLATVSSVLLLLTVAVIGKLACGLAAGPKADRATVALGMTPRGEVGLIFAATGRDLGVISDNVFAVLVFVVLLTTLIPSVALRSLLARRTQLKAAP